jgi:hypothetical protein
MISLATPETEWCRAGSPDPAVSLEARRGLETPPYIPDCMNPYWLRHPTERLCGFRSSGYYQGSNHDGRRHSPAPIR